MTTLQDISTLCEAEAALKQHGIFVDTVYQDVIVNTRYHYGTPPPNHGIHVYFNQGRTNLAYFTPLMRTLTILDRPRPDAMCGEKHFIRRPAPQVPAFSAN